MRACAGQPRGFVPRERARARRLTCVLRLDGASEPSRPAPPRLLPSQGIASVGVRSWRSAPILCRRPRTADTPRNSTWCPPPAPSGLDTPPDVVILLQLRPPAEVRSHLEQQFGPAPSSAGQSLFIPRGRVGAAARMAQELREKGTRMRTDPHAKAATCIMGARSLPPEGYISRTEAAHRSGYRVDQIRIFARNGRLHARRVINRWFINERALDAFTANRATRPKRGRPPKTGSAD
jgi:hypothetical protein